MLANNITLEEEDAVQEELRELQAQQVSLHVTYSIYKPKTYLKASLSLRLPSVPIEVIHTDGAILSLLFPMFSFCHRAGPEGASGSLFRSNEGRYRGQLALSFCTIDVLGVHESK